MFTLRHTVEAGAWSPDSARLELSRLTTGTDGSLAGVFRRVCEIAADTLRADRVGIWLFVDGRKALRCAHLFEAGPRQHSEGVTLRIADFPGYFTGLDLQRVMTITDTATDPAAAELAEPYFVPLDVRATMDAPVYLDGAVIGIVCYEQTGRPRDWSTGERDFAVSVADLVAVKINTAELADARAALRTRDEHLAEVRRMDAVGRMAAGLAHDLNTLLSVVHGSAVMLGRQPGQSVEAREWTRHILEAAERGTALAADLGRCARESARPARVVSPGEVAERMAPLLRAAAGSRCPLTVDARGGTGKVFIEPSGLERILLNMVTNARDAMPDGGPITVGVNTANFCPADEPLVCIEVADAGTGIDPAVRDLVFEPFFTTKAKGAGTGLGLAVVKQVVDRAGGRVEVDTTPGRGTTFRILLPRVTA